jgi:hypothetical protein
MKLELKTSPLEGLIPSAQFSMLLSAHMAETTSPEVQRWLIHSPTLSSNPTVLVTGGSDSGRQLVGQEEVVLKLKTGQRPI